MFCENCGNKFEGSDRFCTKCGHRILPAAPKEGSVHSAPIPNDRWWYRLLKVLYIFLYIPLPFTLWGVWVSNATEYDRYSRTTIDTTDKAFWYSLLALFIYIASARLIKIIVRYIVFGHKPNWGEEVKLF
jgi:hypothetical protein